MAIELDTTRHAAQLAAATANEPSTANATSAQKLSSLLGGAPVKVTDGSMTDLEALVARLKNDQEKSKYTMLMASLGTIGDSLTEAQKKKVEEGMKLADEEKALENRIMALDGEIASAKAGSLVLQAKIDALTKQIEAAVEDQKEHNRLVREQAELKAELAVRNAAVEKKEEARKAAANDLSKVSGKISALIDSIGVNVLKTIANEFAQIMKPEEQESNAQEDKREKKAEEVDVFLSIRDAIDKFEAVLRDTLEENRTNMV